MNGNDSPVTPAIVSRTTGDEEIVDRLACNPAVVLQHDECSTAVSTPERVFSA